MSFFLYINLFLYPEKEQGIYFLNKMKILFSRISKIWRMITKQLYSFCICVDLHMRTVVRKQRIKGERKEGVLKKN